jgi:hypothetical protein
MNGSTEGGAADRFVARIDGDMATLVGFGTV